MWPVIALGLLLWGCGDNDSENKNTTKDTDSSDNDASVEPTDTRIEAAQPDVAEVKDVVTYDAQPADVGASAKTLSEAGHSEFIGNPDTLFAAKNGCYAINNKGDSFELIQLTKNQAPTLVAQLPGAGKRSYGTSLLLSNGLIAATYQSTKGFPAQSDGTDQGLVLVTQQGQLVADYQLFNQYGATRPSALLEISGKLLVLTNNCETSLDAQGKVVCAQDASIFKLDSSQPQTPNIQEFEIPNVRNASAMGVQQKNDSPQLVIAAAGDYNIAPEGISKIVTVNPDTLNIDQSYDGIKGIGLNGNAPVSNANMVLFTGQTNNGQSIALFDGQQLNPLQLPNSLANPYVAGAEFFGSNILFNLTDFATNSITHYLFNTQDNTVAPVGSGIKGSFNLPFVKINDESYCSGVAGSSTDNNGLTHSTVYFWDAQ